MKNENEIEVKARPRFSSTKKKPNNWKEHEDKLLLEKAKENHYRNWSKVASYIKGRSAIQCSARYKRIQPGLIKGAWTIEEDEKLVQLAKNFGRNWCNIAKYMPTRTGKQIRDRFLNALDPQLNKNKFTREEDNKIVELYKVYGKSWCLIAQNLSGRTGDMVKNRFYSSLKKHVNNDTETNHSLLGQKRRTSRKSLGNTNTKKDSNSNSSVNEIRGKLNGNANKHKKRVLKSIRQKLSMKDINAEEDKKKSIFTTNTNLIMQSNSSILPGFMPNIDNKLNSISMIKDNEFGACMAQIYETNLSQTFNPVPSLSLKLKNESAMKENSFICENRNYSSMIHSVFSNPFNARPQGGLQNLQFAYNNNTSNNLNVNVANHKAVNDHFKKLTYEEQVKYDNLKLLIDEQSFSGLNKDNILNQLKLLKEIKGIIKEKQTILNKN